MMHLLSLYLLPAALQMQYPFPDLLCSPLIPELRSNIAACPPRHIHFILIGTAAVWALPDQLAVSIVNNIDLSVIAAFLTVIALGIQLRIHDIIIKIGRAHV